MNASDFFSPEDKKLIEKAILDAERNTSGEIRVHVETTFKGDILDRATAVFALLNMHRTKLRNGVLIFLAIKNRQFAILGDAGINRVVPDNFWNTTKSAMENHFINSEFALGLIAGITMAGEQMKKHFPHQQDDINELSNEMTFDTHEK
jgi:uncharacterized membrane protein